MGEFVSHVCEMRRILTLKWLQVFFDVDKGRDIWMKEVVIFIDDRVRESYLHIMAL